MRKHLVCAFALLVLALPGAAQVESVKLKVRAVLVDRDLNQKPVPKLALALRRLDQPAAEEIALKTGFDGIAEAKVPPGKYRLATPQAVEFQGKRYSWEVELVLSDAEQTVELSNDNAKVSEAPPQQPARATDELTTLFKRLQNSVVTVWSEGGHGTGFFVDAKGLVMTNQHVVETSEYLAVQFDPGHKVAAKLLAADSQKDVAVLWANLSALPEATVAPIARPKENEPSVVEGERVFTIGSPLHQQKIMTTGIVSKVEPHAIISDININHGNSGGPLFNSRGFVVGLTTFGEPDRGGPGLSGIVRIEEAALLMERAKAKMRDVPRPQGTLLPVEPTDRFPLDALKTALEAEKFDVKPYGFSAGDYDVWLITPIYKYRSIFAGELAATREKEKRTKRKQEAVKGTVRPLEDLKNWAEYVGQYRPVIEIEADPKFRETFWSAFGRGLAASGGNYGAPAKMRFKTDFYKMKLYCGQKEVIPIQPAKIVEMINQQNRFVNATDATYRGFYLYPADAISPACGDVTLELYSEKDPNKATVKVLSDKTVERIWSDFEPYRKAPAASPEKAAPAKN